MQEQQKVDHEAVLSTLLFLGWVWVRWRRVHDSHHCSNGGTDGIADIASNATDSNANHSTDSYADGLKRLWDRRPTLSVLGIRRVRRHG